MKLSRTDNEHIKRLKLVVILITLVISFAVQAFLNPQGYNYLLYAVAFGIFCHFDKITYLEIGALKIKIEKIQIQCEKMLVAIFKTQLQIQVIKGTQGLAKLLL